MISFWQEIQTAAKLHALDPTLVAALVKIESRFDPWAWNPEPQYRYLWDVKARAPFRQMTPEEQLSEYPPPDFPCFAGDPDQEFWAQQASWGLMQVMGAIAREEGFIGPYIPALCQPTIGLMAGCSHLARQLTWAGGNVQRALAAYNGGHWKNDKPPYRNAEYAAKVLGAKELLA